jgi:hypothetical protein
VNAPVAPLADAVTAPFEPPKHETFVGVVLTVIVTPVQGFDPQGRILLISLIITLPPALSRTWICVAPAGGVTVVPVAKVLHPAGVVQEVAGINPFKHCPNVHE